MKIIADENIPFIEKACKSVADVELVAGRAITPAMLKNADALLVRSITKVSAELLEGSKVKFIGTATIGTDHVDIDYLKSRGIGFSSAPGSNANSVAEYITAAMLTIAERRNITLEGKTLGIIGVGNVGSRVEKKALALGMKVICNDPPLQRQTGDTSKYRPIEDIFGCDIITVHTPLTKSGEDKTYHLCDENFFKSVKAGTIFFNSSRGEVHETTAIKNAMKSGWLSAAVLDVWENEPNIDAELLEMVDLASPHIAGYSYDGKIIGMIMVYEAMCRHLGLEIKHTANDFLPEPIVPIIEIEKAGTQQEHLRYAVKRIYDIEADDQRCRAILDTPQQECGKYFDMLRKTYPIRREFQNTVIKKADSKLANKLAGLGFKIG